MSFPPLTIPTLLLGGQKGYKLNCLAHGGDVASLWQSCEIHFCVLSPGKVL